MRQRDDPVFAQMLDRIRVGNPLVEDIALLESRTMNHNNDKPKCEQKADKFIELKKEYPNMLCLFALVEDTDNFNKTISERLKIKTIDIPCNDSIPRSKVTNKKKKINKRKGDSNKYGNYSNISESQRDRGP